eukprot:364734-Chlamydomonas_euryale.AAC.5
MASAVNQPSKKPAARACRRSSRPGRVRSRSSPKPDGCSEEAVKLPSATTSGGGPSAQPCAHQL